MKMKIGGGLIGESVDILRERTLNLEMNTRHIVEKFENRKMS